MRKALTFGCSLLCVLAFTACNSTFALDVKADRPDKVVSLFVVAADKDKLKASDDTLKIESIVDPENHNSYYTIAQFKPKQLDRGWTWEELRVNDSAGVGIKFDVDDDALAVTVPKKLTKTYPLLELAVLINCGSRGWRAEKVLTREIENSKTMSVAVSSDNLRRLAQ